MYVFILKFISRTFTKLKSIYPIYLNSGFISTLVIDGAILATQIIKLIKLKSAQILFAAYNCLVRTWLYYKIYKTLGLQSTTEEMIENHI